LRPKEEHAQVNVKRPRRKSASRAAGVVAVFVAAATATYVLVATTTASSPEPITAPEQAARAVIESAPASQRLALADGIVTADELSAGWKAYAECAAARGYLVLEEIPGKGKRPTMYRLGVPVNDANDQEALAAGDEALRACRREHLESLEAADALRLPSTEEVGLLYDFLRACLASDEPLDEVSAGSYTTYPTAPRGMEPVVLPEQRLRYTRCAAEGEARTGLRSPSPIRH
jgi:hypothetical protein